MALVHIALRIVVAFILYAYSAWFARRTNGWPEGPGALAWRAARPLVLASRALTKRVDVLDERRLLAYSAASVVSVLAGLVLLFLPWRATGPALLGWEATLPMVLASLGLGVVASAAGGWATGSDVVRQSAWALAVRSWLFLAATALALAGPLVLTGSGAIRTIVAAQSLSWPFLLYQPLGVYVLTLSMLLSSIRVPQDALRAENWPAADFALQHAGWPSALYHWAEHLHVMLAAAVVSLVYLGGWEGLGVAGWPWGLLKTVAVTLLLEWLRPRLMQRYRGSGPWAVCLALGALNLLLTIGFVLLRNG